MERIVSRMLLVAALAVSAALAAAACRESSGEIPARAGAGAPATATKGAQVARVVFLDKQDACACTRRRIDGSWAVLEKALASRRDVEVERLLEDMEPAKVEPYRGMKAYVVLPAIYFLDRDGGLVEMLQGEVTSGQVEALLLPASRPAGRT